MVLFVSLLTLNLFIEASILKPNSLLRTETQSTKIISKTEFHEVGDRHAHLSSELSKNWNFTTTLSPMPKSPFAIPSKNHGSLLLPFPPADHCLLSPSSHFPSLILQPHHYHMWSDKLIDALSYKNLSGKWDKIINYIWYIKGNESAANAYMIKRGKKKEDNACIKYHSKLKTMTTY